MPRGDGLLGSPGGVVVSVDSLLDDHEVAVRATVDELRQEAERVAVALGEAERALEHVSITRATLAAVLAGHGAVAGPAQGIDVPERESAGGGVGAPGRVPQWCAGLGEAHLPAGYQQLWPAVRDAGAPVRAQELARTLGLEPTPANVEGLRSKLKRLVARGWIAEPAPGVFAAAG
jgi:hypothetical protein